MFFGNNDNRRNLKFVFQRSDTLDFVCFIYYIFSFFSFSFTIMRSIVLFQTNYSASSLCAMSAAILYLKSNSNIRRKCLQLLTCKLLIIIQNGYSHGNCHTHGFDFSHTVTVLYIDVEENKNSFICTFINLLGENGPKWDDC